MIEVFVLPNRLDSSVAQFLITSLMERRGQPLQLDASAVELVGALSLEVLIAAGRQWDVDGQPISLLNPSDRFATACEILGLNVTAPWVGKSMAVLEQQV